MRLDKFLVSTGKLSRSDAGRAARAGRITVNGMVEKHADRAVFPERDSIFLDGSPLTYRKYTYVLLNKPDGYVSATEDGNDPTVLTLLPEELQRVGLFPCGRLDKHTLGLMLLTNNGELSHRLLSPRHHVEKRYAYTCRDNLGESERLRLEAGVTIDGYTTKPAKILPDDARHGVIILTEGKYHQIKRMFEAVGNKITALERVSFGPLTADPTLGRGEWRFLTDDEVRVLERWALPAQAEDRRPSEEPRYLLLIRHGVTDWNQQCRRQGRRDIPLNERGIEQATAAGAALAGLCADVIVSSPLSRATETAACVADGIGYPRADIRTDDRLLERDFGDTDGMTGEEIRAYRAAGGKEKTESLDALRARMLAALEAICRERHRCAVVVSHSAAIKSVFVKLYGQPELQRHPTKNLGVSVIRVENGKMTPVAFDREAGDVRTLLTELNLISK